MLSKLPSVHALAEKAAVEGVPRWATIEAARQLIGEARARGGGDVAIDEVRIRAHVLAAPGPHPVINATGVVLHTNLGRAPLSAAALAAIQRVGAHYADLEYDVATGERGSRHDHLREMLCALTGAEDAAVVNNNAAATVLGLAALATDREIVVSRGELIEIGGSFRLPEILALSRGRMVEVGTTNKTHLRDYQQAITADTGLLLKVHRSNFAIVGFTAEVTCEQLVGLGVPVMVDLGSGMFVPREQQRAWHLPEEPTVAETVASGADLVTFSGDKLLGGPQAGILVGTRAAIAKARAHPLMRAVRPDKLVLAALGATLAAYRSHGEHGIPTVRMLSVSADELRTIAEALRDAIGSGDVRACTSAVGGGAMPTAALPSFAVVLPAAIEPRLRDARVIARVHENATWLDVRTVAPDERDRLAQLVRTALNTEY